MGRIYVCNGAQLKCSMGTSSSVLVVLPERKILLDGQPQANIMDHESMTNIQPFGLCCSLANPVVAAATAAHLGVLTPMPCKPNTNSPWVKGERKLLLKDFPALCQDDILSCAWKGTISIVDCGQGKGQGAFPLSKEGVEGVTFSSKEKEEKYKIVLKDAYWVKDGMKIRLIPHQKKVTLYVVFAFEPDKHGKSKENAEFELKFIIPRHVDTQLKEIRIKSKNKEIVLNKIKGSDILEKDKEIRKSNLVDEKKGFFLYSIDNFSSDLSDIKGSILCEI